MAHIQKLDQHVADLIAAGEVVERPASVVKELVENSIDAGAGSVTVEIRRGGMEMIRVTDDGCGIPEEEVELAFLRHATSKLRTEHDLEAIGTLGFRGEALAAIAAVSRMEMMTRTADSTTGVALDLEGGQITLKEESGCPVGTTMIVRDLFFNTPARLKFVRRDSAESAAVLSAVQREALAHPEVSFAFIRDGKTDLRTPGDGQPQSALYSVLGRDLALGFLPAKGSGEDGVTVSGFVSAPVCCRGTRSHQFFFINGRWIKSQTLTAALEQAYANQKMVGKFPACVLYITTKLSAVDVNVHPAKTEVKFVTERQIFDAVYQTVLSALEGEEERPALHLDKPTPEDKVTAEQVRIPLSRMETRDTMRDRPVTPGAFQPAGPAARPAADQRSVSGGPETREGPVQSESSAQPEKEPDVSVPAEEENQPAPDTEMQPWRLVGQMLDTYIIVEQGDTITIIDKHAAHERMCFDRLKSQDWRPMSQPLLEPQVFTPAPEEANVLLENLSLLEEFGFEVEDFGGGALLLRQIPYDIGPEQGPAVLCELAGRLLTTGGRADPSAARDEMIHTIACKAAIKGGQKNDTQELETVARAVLSGQVRYCPHGRPVAIELTRSSLEKQFKRT
ncbi:MAG: DNA mismatch repair endonuclease MutL [Oscillospiraceae bacterium]|nr:DNA mismatch repair endonuclease MutL [Oscillospiraceae bacterium]